MVIQELKHEGHEGNEGGLSDDSVGLLSVIARKSQKEIVTLRDPLTFVSSPALHQTQCGASVVRLCV
jgi:hypothetical protein